MRKLKKIIQLALVCVLNVGSFSNFTLNVEAQNNNESSAELIKTFAPVNNAVTSNSASGFTTEFHTEAQIRAFAQSNPVQNLTNAYTTQPKKTSPYNAGVLTTAVRNDSLNMVNLLRYISGVPADITLNSTYNTKTQACALVSAINGGISHTPTTPSGMDATLANNATSGCGSSNLASGYFDSADSIWGYVDDSDASNISRVGHRRWLLNPKMKQTGIGAVDRFYAMYSMDQARTSYSNTAVIWPGQNTPVEYFRAHPLFHGSEEQAWMFWSLTSETASNITVSMKNDNTGVTKTFSSSNKTNGYFNVNNENYGPGGGAIIWRPNNTTYKAGDKYTITITGLKRGTVSYKVHFFNLIDVSSVSISPTTMKLNVGGTGNLTTTVLPVEVADKSVTYTSSNTSVATVSSSGVVTAKAAGTATITVKSVANTSKTATCTVTVTKPVTSVSLNKTSTTINVGSTETLTATVSPSDASNKTINWSSGNTSVATVSSSGIVTAKAPGSTTITATAADGSGKKATCTVTVKQLITGISLSKTTTSLNVGSTERLTATISPSNASNKNVTWSSSNTSIVTVSTSGLITAKAKGSATITVSANDGSGKKATCTVTVIQPVTGISLNKTSTSINIGSTETIVATITPSNASDTGVTWSSSNTSVATVSTAGVVTPKAVGTVTITATATGNTSKKATCTVTVKRLATGISLNKISTTLDAGTTETLVATVTPSDTSNKTVTWTSSNTSVATVSSSGVVTARSTGTATITAKTSDGTNKTATCTVTVQKAVTNISLNKTSLNLNAGNSETLTVTYTPSDATNKWVTWTSSNTNVATVNSSGRVTAVHGGTATITATTSNNISKTCTVTVYEPVSSVSVSPSTYTINVGETVGLTPTISPSTASNKNVSYSSENSSVATVNSSGVVTGGGPGATRIKVTSSDNSSKYTYVEITVIQPVTGVTIPNWSQTIYTDQRHQYSVNVYPNNASDKSVTWTSEDESIATVDQTGLVTPKSAGVVRIWATSNSNSNRKDYAEVTVLQRVTGISISNWNQTIYTNQTYDFGVNTTVYPYNASNKTIRWESNDTSIATVDENGVVTGVGPGTTRVYAYSTDGGNRSDYAQVTVLQKVTGVSIIPWKDLPIAINGTYNLADNTTVYPSNASNKELTWTSNNTSVATVDNSGIVTGISEGTARITATSVDDPSISDYATVVIKPGVSSVTILEGNKTLYKGDTQQYTVSVSPDNAFNKEVTWESSNPEVASVDSNGRVTAKRSGTTTISATAKDGTGKKSEVTVTVKEIITNLIPENTVYEAFVGDEISAEVEIIPYTASNCMLTWTSSDTGVVEVISTYNSLNSYSQYGNALLSANNPGTANITIKTTDGSNITKVIKVVVKKKVENISIRTARGWGYPGDTDTLEAVVTPSDATNKTVKWTSSNTSVATINSTGLLTMKGPGYTLITASATDGSGVTSTYYYYVYSRPVESLRIKDWHRELKVGDTWSIKAEVLPENATNKNVIWKSEDESIATVDKNGKVTAKKEGIVRIYATSEYNSNHKDFATVKVIPKAANTKITLSKTSATIGTMNVGKYKNTLQLKATVTGNSNTKVTWTSSNPKVAKVDKNTGKVTGVSDPSHLVTTVTITATTSDGKKATCKVTVEDPVSAFVRRLYKYCLNRNPDKGGFKYWVDNLKSKKMNAADVVKGFFDSKEMKDMKLSNAETIERCYLVMMDRKSDKGGKEYWIKNYAKYGKTYVLRGFVDSKEFTQICKDFNITRGTIK